MNTDEIYTLAQAIADAATEAIWGGKRGMYSREREMIRKAAAAELGRVIDTPAGPRVVTAEEDRCMDAMEEACNSEE